MAAVRGKHTTPEMRVRRIAHRLGYRYSLHKKSLPGAPDLVFTSRRKAIFVNGCFWHQHHCKRGRAPASNVTFWSRKLARNVERDRANVRELRRLGWSVLTLWECQVGRPTLAARIARFLDSLPR